MGLLLPRQRRALLHILLFTEQELEAYNEDNISLEEIETETTLADVKELQDVVSDLIEAEKL